MSRMENKSKNKKTPWIIAIVIIVIIAVILAFVLGRNTTVESYADDKSEIITEFEKNFNKETTKFNYDENKIIIENRMAKSMSPEDVDSFKEILENESEHSEKGMEDIINKLEKDMDIEDITISITYFDEDDEKILTKEYK